MNDELRIKRQLEAHRRSRNDALMEASKQQHGPQDAEFLKGMRDQVYNTDGTTMEERIRQNRHYTQSSGDMDSQGFLKR